MDDNKKTVENLHEYYKPLKKDGRLFMILFLTTMPGFCFMSVKLHIIKLAARDNLRCEIKSFENTSWNSEDIRKLSEPVDVHKECYIYNYDYNKFRPMTLKQAQEMVHKEFPNSEKILCPKFIITANNGNSLIPDSYPKEFVSYCESIRDDIFYDIGAAIPYILSCLFVVPLADIFGRKRILKIGCQVLLFGVFMKIIFLDYTREAIGEGILHVGYPCLMYATEAIVFETAEKKLKPFAFMVRFIGRSIPPLIFGLVPPPSSIYWKHMLFATYSLVLILPLMPWFFPESVPWFASRKENKLAEFIGQSLVDPSRHNEVLFRLRNRRRSLNDVKKLLQGFREINTLQFVIINVIAFTAGLSSVYLYSIHKFLYHHLDTWWMTFLSVSGGFIGLILTIPCVYLMNVVKFLLAGTFLINGILYSLLANFYTDLTITITLKFFMEMIATVLTILLEFYVHHIFPTSHRCLCVALCGASQVFGLFIVVFIMHLHILTSQILASAGCIIGCILTLLAVKNVYNDDQFLNFSDAELELTKKRQKIFCLII